MRPIQQACYWFSTVSSLEPKPPLSGKAEADITVVGAGFTGLWTAYFLKLLKPSLSVAVVEQGVCGYGASGRNAGIVSPCLDHSHALAIAHFGRDEALRMAKVGLENIKELSEWSSHCDFNPSGLLHVALTQDQIAACQETAEVAAGLGLGGHVMLSAEETRRKLNSPLYMGALQIQAGGTINPMKLVGHLKYELESRGVALYEGTKVTGFGDCEVRTESGTIKTEKIILATDAYTHLLFPQLLNHFIPLYDYIMVSEPLTDAQLDSIGWSERQGVMDGRTFFNYYRMTADNRILWGTSEAMYYPPNRVDEGCDHSEAHYRSLRESFQRHFPQLSGLKFEYAWGGPIASTTRLTPFFGTLNKGQIYYALGYTGHGIGTTRVAGKILAHMATRIPNDLLNLKMVSNKPFPYPPEPLRALAVNMVTRSLQSVDAGNKPNLLLKMLDVMGIGFSS